TQQQLWRSIPSRHNKVCIFPRGRSTSLPSYRWWFFKLAGETKVGNLEDSVVVDEKIGGFDVSVEYLHLLATVSVVEGSRGTKKTRRGENKHYANNASPPTAASYSTLSAVP